MQLLIAFEMMSSAYCAGSGQGALRRLRLLLLVSTALAGGAMHASVVHAQAARQIVVQVSGADGGDGQHNTFESDVSSSAGMDGPPIGVTTSDAISLTAPFPSVAVFLESTGGVGGGGDENISASDGGAGGAINLTVGTAIALTGGTNFGVWTTSIGGAGGGGAFASTFDRSSINPSSGGNGGAATVTIGQRGSLDITNQPLESGSVQAVAVSSIGGAGGAGGSIDGGFFNGYPGDGGTGGAGGLASLSLDGRITASGSGTVGVSVTSAGGRGGDGGTDGGDVVAGAPGDGGAGGTGGQAVLAIGTTGSISTSSTDQPAILVASQAGNGGNGGGGGGTDGSYGGAGGSIVDSAGSPSVNFSNAGRISTQGDLSPAVTLQSVGGSGGNAEGSAPGGAGGAGGTVLGNNSGTITTSGSFGFGIFAQSVGGTGGDGGDATFGGGAGGSAGRAGTVSITNSGVIETRGSGAIGLVAQSVGGGNASAAINNADFQLSAGSGSGAGGQGTSWFTFATSGGAGGTGGDGGAVSVSNTGTISTQGDMAPAVWAQSIGGGGAAGGSTSGSSLFINISSGGDGGAGGKGGAVTVSRSGDSGGGPGAISTMGASSPGITAYSNGGGGGVGGGVGSDTYALGLGISLAIGGAGGTGNTGGAVTVDNTAAITTGAIDSHGIQAMSIGGGGGAGGQANSSSSVVGTADIPAVSLSSAIGGTGGSGGHGGLVQVTNSGRIITRDDQSYGIYASSIGGGGGLGANAAATAQAFGTGEDIQIAVAIGGASGTAGDGGNVEVSNQGRILTRGRYADAVHLSSIGGGGGNGGTGAATDGEGTFAKQSVGLGLSIGGSGSASGTGGTVTFTNQGAITTTGGDARAIFLQSVGGGGGTASGAQSAATAGTSTATGEAGSQITLTVGSSGSGGGTGGAVTATNAAGASLRTYGAGAHGIHIQSVGGGGGQGGGASAGAEAEAGSGGDSDDEKDNPYSGLIDQIIDKIKDKINEKAKESVKDALFGKSGEGEGGEGEGSDPVKWSANLAIGGQGGASGDGGAATATNAGSIVTSGHGAAGILAQSVGGGGGGGGASATSGSQNFNLDLGIGGRGGSTGNGGTVTVTNSGTINTSGALAYGIHAQSIGGGGGVGAASADDTSLSVTLTLGIGGGSSASGAGGSVTLANTGSIATTGREAHGIVAVRVGGGGGSHLLNIPATASGSGGDADPTVGASAGMALEIGGRGGAGGTGGTVDITHGGSIATSGAMAFGILAQSIGGGGGFGGGSTDSALFNIAGTLGGAGGSGNDGGAVRVTLHDGARVSTSGAGPAGIFLQSIGGGGGYSGGLKSETLPSYASFVAQDGGGGGSGGAIQLLSAAGARALIHTTGAAAHGIFAQSIGGGGGALGTAEGLILNDAQDGQARAGASGRGGPVTIDLSGQVQASGANAHAIYVQSGVQKTDGTIHATGGSGPISVTFSGDITGGTGTGAGIRLDGGTENVIAFSGGTLSAGSGTAISVTNASGLKISNSGTIVGNISTGGAASLDNLAGGRLHPGDRLGLGGGTLTNVGTLDLAGPGRIGATTLTGNLEQSHGGRWQVDLDLATGAADSLTVDGAARLGGTVAPQVTQLPVQLSTTSLPAATILTATTLDATNATVQNSQVVSYSLDTATAGQARLLVDKVSFSANAGGSGASANQTAAASHLQALWNGGNLGSSQMADHFSSLMNIASPAAYRKALQELSPESNAVASATAPHAAANFHNTLHSCPVFVGMTARLGEESCSYARGIFTTMRHSSEGQFTGYNQHEAIFQFGGQKQIADRWYLGGSLAYGNRSLVAHDGSASGTGENYAAGLVLKRQVGENWLFAGSLGYSYGTLENARLVTVAGAPLTASSEQKIHSYSGRLKGAYNVDLGAWYLRPGASLEAVHVRVPAYAESGAGALNMRFDSASDSQVGLSPELEVGGRLDLADAVLRPYGKLGLTWWSDASWTQTSRLAGGPGGPSVQTSFKGDDLIGRAEVGLDLVHMGGIEFKAQYGADMGRDFVAHTGSVRLGIRF